MKDYVITSFPMKPSNKMKVGSLTAPLFVSFISNKLKIKKVLSLNMLNSFKDIDYSKEYVEILKGINLEYDDVLVDKEHLSELLDKIRKIDNIGLLIPKRERILKCNCGKVDMLFSSLNSFDNGLIIKENDKFKCSSCECECEVIEEERLFIKIDSKYLSKVKAIPNMYDDNLNTLNDEFKDKCYLISKSRTTGVKYNNYNLDIDFVWSLYTTLFNEKNIIIVTSNRHLMKVFFCNYIANIFDKNLIYLLHPYIEKKDTIDWNVSLFKYDYYYQHLYLIYNCRWNSKDCFYDIGMFNSLAKLRGEGRKKLYEYLLNCVSINNLFEYLNDFITNKINFQNNFKEMNKNRLLITDYDNSLHIYYDSLKEKGYKFKFGYQYYSDFNINKRINKFRKNNYFCINTGRSYNSFKNICNYKYDYLICNNGCEIYDSNDEAVYVNPISKKDIDVINNYNFKDAVVKMYYPHNKDNKYLLTAVSITETKENIFNEIIEYFTSNLEYTKVYFKYPKIRLVNDLTNKLIASNKLIELRKFIKDNVYALGDDDNDYCMLKEYKSGTFKWATDKVKMLNIKEYDSAIEFMNIIEDNKYEE